MTKAALAITRFSQFLASPAVAVDRLDQVDRALLERYLADLHTELAGRKIHADRISQLHLFLQTIRRHGWDESLPANAMIHNEDFPKRGQLLPRALAEQVMTQLDDPGNLDQWNDPERRLITLILIRCGLRAAARRHTAAADRLHRPRRRQRPLPALHQPQDET